MVHAVRGSPLTLAVDPSYGQAGLKFILGCHTQRCALGCAGSPPSGLCCGHTDGHTQRLQRWHGVGDLFLGYWVALSLHDPNTLHGYANGVNAVSPELTEVRGLSWDIRPPSDSTLKALRHSCEQEKGSNVNKGEGGERVPGAGTTPLAKALAQGHADAVSLLQSQAAVSDLP
ncbi:hypothetical protein P3T73_07400 [Kiritimatiellota bacterium B12222]|nr:hypothetical protein P3T73_07400 [Kiritimatiellota bacterium B12222]